MNIDGGGSENRRRSSIEIMSSVLEAVREQRNGGVNPDGGFAVKKRDLMRSANVNHTQLGNYLDRLDAKGFIVRYDGDDGLHLGITDRGEQLLERAQALAELIH